jgi:hypothetical protein
VSLRVVSFWALIVVAMMDNSGVAETHLQFHGSFRDTGPGEVSTFTLDLYLRAGVTHATTISDFERAPSLTSGSYTAEYPIRAHVGITITPPNVLGARAPAPLGLVPWERMVVASHHQVHRTGQARGSPVRAHPPPLALCHGSAWWQLDTPPPRAGFWPPSPPRQAFSLPKDSIGPNQSTTVITHQQQ